MGPAGQPFEPPMKVSSPCRNDRLVARSARRILRKLVEASKERASPADAFCPEAPCPRATTQASRKCQSRHMRDPRQSRGFTLMKLNLPLDGQKYQQHQPQKQADPLIHKRTHATKSTKPFSHIFPSLIPKIQILNTYLAIILPKNIFLNTFYNYLK
jgi:hypothetical protein